MTQIAPHPPLTKYYDDPSQREGYVRSIFDETAPWYDWATVFLSFGSGNWYRREAVKRAGLVPGMRLLDLASGTGVVARAAAEVMGGTTSILGMDASIGMLHSGRVRNAKVQSPAESLPLRDASFDRITIGFALRRLQRIGRRLRAGERGLDGVVERLAHAAGLERGELGGGELELVARDGGLREAGNVFLQLRRLVGVGTRADVARGDRPLGGALGGGDPLDELQGGLALGG